MAPYWSSRSVPPPSTTSPAPCSPCARTTSLESWPTAPAPPSCTASTRITIRRPNNFLRLYPDLRADMPIQANTPSPGAHFERFPRRDGYQARARPHSGLIQVFQQLAVPLEHAGYRDALPRPRFGQELQAALPPVGRRIHPHDVAVRAHARRPQPFHQLALEIGRNGMLQLFGFVVHFVPFQTENLGQHALDQVVPVPQPAGDLPAGRRKRNLSLGAHADQPVPLQPLNRHRDRRRRNVQPARHRDGLDRLAFRLGLRDGLEVVFFGDGNSHALNLSP